MADLPSSGGAPIDTSGYDTSGWGPFAFIMPGGASPEVSALNKVDDAGFPTDFNGRAALEQMYQRGLNQGPTANPYNTALANKTRPDQLALYQQMMGQMNGPSLAGMQGRFAGDRGMRAQLQAQAGGGPLAARGVGVQGAQAAGGLAGQTGHGALQEQMGLAGQVGQGMGQMRGLDATVAAQQAHQALQARALDNQRTQFYIQQGMTMDQAMRQASIDRYTITKKLQGAFTQQQASNAMRVVQGAATIAGMPIP